MEGNDVVVTYAKLTDRLRYVEREPLNGVGLSGTAPALTPVGKAHPKSKLGSVVLWKAPHGYRVKAPEPVQTTAETPATSGAQPAK
jgi:hypothetical protein